MTQPTVEELAKQGDTNAMVAARTAEGIATTLHRSFEPKGAIAKAAIKNGSLFLLPPLQNSSSLWA